MKVIYIILLEIIVLTLSAQNHTDVLERYWNYRYHLVGDRIAPAYQDWEPGMMIVGSCEGCSEPAKTAQPNLTNKSTNFEINNWNNCGIEMINGHRVFNLPEEKGVLGWAENQYSLSNYLMVLTTELKLLLQNNQPTKQTETELYYALKAVERLDYEGEEMYGLPGELNGFVARDDVPTDFCYNHQMEFGGKYYWIESDEACRTSSSDCSENGCYNDKQSSQEMSKDQALALITGLYMVWKILPANTVLSQSPDPGYDPRVFARDEALRIINYMRNSEGGNNWRIAKPVNCDNSYYNLVCRGSNVKEFSWPFYMISRELEGHSVHDKVWPLSCWSNNADGSTCWNYWLWRFITLWYNSITSANGHMPYNYANECNNLNGNPHFYPAANSYFNYNMVARLSLMYGPIRKNPFFNTEIRSSLANLSLAFIGFDDAYFASGRDALDDEWWYDLMGGYLRNYSPLMGYNRYFCRFFQHPDIQVTNTPYGNYFLNGGSYGCNIPPVTRLSTNGAEVKIGNQLSYMLTANLMQLKWQNPYYDLATGQVVTYSNLMQREVTNTFPFSFGGHIYGNDQYPVKIHAAYIMENRGKEQPGSRVDFQAPHIGLLPGFFADYGSTVTIQPGRMECGGNGILPFATAKTDETMNGSVEDNLTEDIMSHQDSIDVERIKEMGLEAYLEYTYDSLAVIYPEMAKEAGYINVSEQLSEKKEPPSIEVFPNPNNGNFKIRVNVTTSDVISISLCSLMGYTISEIANNYYQSGLYTIDYSASNLSKGIYVIRVSSSKYTLQKQIVIQ